MAQIIPGDTSKAVPPEQSILPITTTRALSLIISSDLLQTAKEYVKRTYPQDTAGEIQLRTTAQRLVTHNTSKFIWRNEHHSALFAPASDSKEYKTSSSAESFHVIVSLDQPLTSDIRVPISFLAVCKADVINVFRIKIDVYYKDNLVHSVQEIPIFAICVGDEQDLKRNIEWCNEISLDISKEKDAFYSYWYTNLEKALPQRKRILSILNSLPGDDDAKSPLPNINITSEKWEQTGPDAELQQIAKQLLTLPDPSTANTRPNVSNNKTKKKPRSIPLNIKTDITMESLYDMISALTPSPVTPVDRIDRIEKPRARKLMPSPIKTLQLEEAQSPAPRQLTPHLLSNFAAADDCSTDKQSFAPGARVDQQQQTSKAAL